MERINADLVNSIGNLLSRTTALSVNKQQEFPPIEQDPDLVHFLSDEDVKMYHSLLKLPGTYFPHVTISYKDVHAFLCFVIAQNESEKLSPPKTKR